VIGLPLLRDERGYEYHFAINHLGHFQLTARLFPALKAANGARVVAVSSRGHRAGGILFDDLHFEHTAYEPMRAYAQSKTANALFALHLDTIAKQHNIRAFSVHPGPIPSSDLFAESAVGIKPAITVQMLRIIAKLMRGLHVTELYNAIKKPDTPDAFKTIQQGASTSVWAATTHDLDNIGGLYLEDCHIAENVADDANIPFGVRPYTTNSEFAKRLWGASEELVGVEWERI
jgi:NAD(P)-dependent dehydrogenase (short-subunit alcohol dehydrogenase family)